MDFVRLNGWAIEVGDGLADFSVSWLDPDFKSELGKQILRRRRQRTSWSFETIPLTALEAETVEGLVGGLGHVWSFESTTAYAFSTRGRAPVAAAALSRVTTLPRFGAACGFLNGSIVWDLARGIAPLLDRWTVSVWRNTGATAADWQHFVVRSDGAVWVDGVRDDTVSTPWLTVFNGFVTITGTNVRIDDLVVLCFVADEEAIAAWRAWQIAEVVGFSDLPELHAEGAFVEGEAVEVIGSIASSSMQTFSLDGIWQNAGRSVAFSLQTRKANPMPVAPTPTVFLSFDFEDGDPAISSPSSSSTAAWTKNGGATIGIADGQVEEAASFDGSGYVAAPNSATMSFSITSNFALCAWVHPRSDSQARTIASKIAAGVAGWTWFLRPVTGGFELVFRMQNAGATLFREISGGLVQLNEWHHVGIIHTSNAARFDLVIDGKLVTTATRILTLATAVTNTQIARIGGVNLPGTGGGGTATWSSASTSWSSSTTTWNGVTSGGGSDNFVGEIDEFYSWTAAVPVSAIEAAYDAGRNRRRLPVQAA